MVRLRANDDGDYRFRQENAKILAEASKERKRLKKIKMWKKLKQKENRKNQHKINQFLKKNKDEYFRQINHLKDISNG